MNSNWIEIVETLQPYKVSDSIERDYHKEIENCFRFLGWKRSNGTIKSEVSKENGNNNSLRIDILLSDIDGNPVLPVEIKRPNNRCCNRQEIQLLSYMRRLKLNVGLYVGENIQLFYDTPDGSDTCISVLKAEICKDDCNGELLCEMLSYKDFDIKKLEDFCKEHYNLIKAKNNLQDRLNEFLSVDKASKNIVSLIKEMFVREGFDEPLIAEELDKYVVRVNRVEQKETLVPAKEKNIEWVVEPKECVKFSLDGINYYGVGPFVREVIKKYVCDNPGITFDELERVFPPHMCSSKENGVVRTFDFLKNNPNRERNFSMKDPISLSDGNVVFINTQWGNSGAIKKYFQNFLKYIGTMYPIYSK